MQSFKLETHVHTAEVSRCANMKASLMVRLYKQAGFEGIVITDHCGPNTLPRAFRDDWSRGADRFLQGYYVALKQGQESGIRIFCGMELQLACSWPNEYLVFGMTPEFIRREGPFHSFELNDFRALALANGLLIYQAHPFRQGWDFYPLKRDFLDGMEVFNANPRHNSRNQQALAYAREHNLLHSSGSDAHEVTDVGRGGMVLQREPRDERELVSLLKTGVLLE